MRRLEQSNAINNWLLLATGAKLRLLETTTVATTPTMVVAPRRTKPVTVERLLPTLGLQRGSVVVVTSSGAEDSDGEDAMDLHPAELAAAWAPSAQELAVRRAALSIGSCCPGLFQPEGAVCLGCGGVVGPPRAAAPLVGDGGASPVDFALEGGLVPAEGLLGAEGAGVAPGGVEVAAPSSH